MGEATVTELPAPEIDVDALLKNIRDRIQKEPMHRKLAVVSALSTSANSILWKYHA